MTGWHVSPTPYDLDLFDRPDYDDGSMLVIWSQPDPVTVDAIARGWIDESPDHWHIAGVERVEWASCGPCAEYHATPEFWHQPDAADDGCDLGDPRQVVIVDLGRCDDDCGCGDGRPRPTRPPRNCAGQLSIGGAS